VITGSDGVYRFRFSNQQFGENCVSSTSKQNKVQKFQILKIRSLLTKHIVIIECLYKGVTKTSKVNDKTNQLLSLQNFLIIRGFPFPFNPSRGTHTVHKMLFAMLVWNYFKLCGRA